MILIKLKDSDMFGGSQINLIYIQLEKLEIKMNID